MSANLRIAFALRCALSKVEAFENGILSEATFNAQQTLRQALLALAVVLLASDARPGGFIIVKQTELTRPAHLLLMRLLRNDIVGHNVESPEQQHGVDASVEKRGHGISNGAHR